MTARTPLSTRALPPGALVNYVRDVPASCLCQWDWRDSDRGGRWVRVNMMPGCPWCDPYPKGEGK